MGRFSLSITPIAATHAATGPSARQGLTSSSPYTNAFYLWLNTATTSLSGLAFWAIVAALYRPEEVGLGAAAVAAVTLLSTLSHLGLGFGLIRFLPQAGEDKPRLLNAAFTLVALTGVIAALVFLAGVLLWSPRLAFLRDQPLYFLAFVAFTAVNTLISVQDQAFVAMRQARFVFWRNLLYVGLRLALPFLIAVSVRGPFGVLAAMGLAALATAALGGPLLRRALPSYRPRPALASEPLRLLLPFSFGNYLSELLLTAPTLVLPLMIVHRLGPSQAGYFYIAWILGYLLMTATVSLALSLFAEGSHSADRLRALSAQAMVAATAMAALGAAVILLAADRLLLLFGPDYAENASGVLRLVALAAIPAAIVNVYLGIQRVRQRLLPLLAISAAMAAATLALAYVLLPGMGLSGAGLALLAGQGLGAALVLASSLIRPTEASLTSARVGADGHPPVHTRRPPSISVLICTLNEAENLPYVLPRIPSFVDEVLIVDGHSSDGTAEIARRLRPDAHVLCQPGYGKGDAIRHGVRQARGDIIVTLDADGQTDPADIPSFLAPLHDGFHFAKGSRFMNGKPPQMSWRRWLGNKALTVTANLIFGTSHSDVCSGYNAFWKDAFLRLHLRESSFEMEQEMLVRASKLGFKVAEVPHQDRGRLQGVSNVRDFYQGLKDLWVIVRERFRD